jgi:putative membrane protein
MATKEWRIFFGISAKRHGIPQVSIFFRRQGKKDIFLPFQVHPGPMERWWGESSCSSRSRFDEEIMVAHGCATHDYNLVSEKEMIRCSCYPGDAEITDLV